MLTRTESYETPYTVRYFCPGSIVAEILDPSWIPDTGDFVLVENKQKRVTKVVWDLWNQEIYVYLGEKDENN